MPRSIDTPSRIALLSELEVTERTLGEKAEAVLTDFRELLQLAGRWHDGGSKLVLDALVAALPEGDELRDSLGVYFAEARHYAKLQARIPSTWGKS